MATLQDVANELNGYIRTYDLYGKVVENVWRTSALSVLLRRRKREVVGGTEWEFRTRLVGEMPPVQRARFYDTLTPERIGNPIKAVVPIGIFQHVISISQDEIEAVRGEAEVIDLLTDKLSELENIAKEQIARDIIYGTGTNNEPVGLETILTQGNNLYGISETTYPRWRPVNIDAATTPFGPLNTDEALLETFTTTSGNDTGIRKIDLFLNYVIEQIKNEDSTLNPNIIATTTHIYGLIKKAFFPQVMLQDEELVDIGFDNIKYSGITIITDDFMPARTMYVLDTNYIEFLVKRGKDMNITDFKMISPLQRVLIAVAEAEFSLVCKSRRRQAKIINLGS